MWNYKKKLEKFLKRIRKQFFSSFFLSIFLLSFPLLTSTRIPILYSTIFVVYILSTLQRPRNAVSPRNPSTVLLRSVGRLLTTTVYLGIFDAETLPEPARGLDGDLYLYPSVLVIILTFFFPNLYILWMLNFSLNVTKDTSQTPFKHLSNTYQTLAKHLPNTCQTPSQKHTNSLQLWNLYSNDFIRLGKIFSSKAFLIAIFWLVPMSVHLMCLDLVRKC